MSNIVVFGCSYEKRKNLAHEVREKFDKESKKRSFPSHYIWRGEGVWKDNLVYNYLLDGAATFQYGVAKEIMNGYADQIIVVGDKKTQKALEKQKTQLQTEIKGLGKEVKFLYEGEGPYPLANTLKIVRDEVGEELVVFKTGDTPLIEASTQEDFQSKGYYDLTLDFNVKKNLNGEFLEKYGEEGVFPRYYNYMIDGELAKEPNDIIMTLNDKTIDLAQEVYELRKGDPLQIARFVLNYVAKPSVFNNAIELVYHISKSKLAKEKINVPSSWVERLGKNLADLRLKASLKHENKGNILDIDSVEDYGFANLALLVDPTIYSEHELIKEFKEDFMPKLASQEMFFDKKVQGAYINNFCDLVGVKSPIDKNGDLNPQTVLSYGFSEQRIKDFIHLMKN